MKPKISLKNNLSLQLVTFLAAVFSTVFYTAIGNASTRQQPKIKNSKIKNSQLRLFKQQYLIAQTWSDLDSQQLSLGTINPQSNTLPSETPIESDEILINQLDSQQQQLIAQTWSNIDSEQLSLATSSQNDTLPSGSNLGLDQLITIETRLNQEQQLIAQTWSDINSQELSLAEPSDRLRPITTPTEINTQPKPQSKPIINPPDKREIAARLTLQKVQIISPAPGVILDQNHNDSVTIQYPPSTSVKLKVNGTQLDESLITQQQLDSRRNLIVQTWKGADLRNGTNTLSLIASKDDINTQTTREVMVKDTSTLTRSAEKSESSTPTNNPQNSTDSQVETTDTTNKPQNTGDIAPPESKPANENKPKPSAKGKPKKQSVKILNPVADSVLDTIHSSVIIQYPKSASVILQVNGKSVDSAQVGRTQVNPVSHEVTQTWYGVIFATGVNTLSVLSTTDGVNYTETSIQVTVPGRPEALKVETVEAEIPADGRAIATVKGRFVDQFGTTTPWNELITLNSSEGKFIGTDLEPDIPGFQVQPEKGEFTAALQASYNAKTVRIRAKSNQLEGYTQTKFKTTLREEPLLTGFANIRIGARGTDYYDSFRDFLPLDEDNDAEIDLDSAAFISGSFRRWSYTGAFNSDRPLNEDNEGENRLFRTYADSEQDYPVLGDNSSTEVTTPSIDKVYFRLERNPLVEFADPDYFMWGDYRTEEFNTEAQEFSAISRQLHGFKSNYNLGNFQFNALYANNAEGFQRDAIAPDGTSGFYFLSRRLLVPGSEDIYIELSPLNDPGNVVSRQRLSLGTDYEINYDRGTLLFNDPVLRTEITPNGDILVRRIVATYQFESEAQDSTLLAGRGRYHFNRGLETPSWLGATYLNEDRGDHDFELWGFDSYVSLGNWGNLIAEYAQSDNQTLFANADGSAYRLEGEVQFSNKIRGRAYYREADEGFANNATLSFIPGQTRYGSQIQAQVSESTELQFSYEHQDNQGVAPRPLDELEEFLDSGFAPVPGNALDNSLTTITTGVQQKIGDGDLGVDVTWRDRSDRKSPEALDSTSTQLRSRFSIPIIEKLNFHALNDLTISNNTDTVFSDRIGLGLDWEFYSGLSLVLNHQWFTRGSLAGEALTSLGLQGEYEPWTNATLTGTYNLSNGEDGINNIGAIGLQQKVTIAPGLNLDFDYEHTFSGFESTSSGRQFSQPFAVGQGFYSLGFSSGSTYGVGIEYTDNPDFSASARWQHSDNSSGGNTVLSADVTGKLTSALTSQFTYNQASSANQEFDIGTSRNLRLGLAYRDPQQDKFNALLRYEYEKDGGTIPETILLGKGTGSQEHLFGVEAIYAPNWRWEFYGKYAFRHSKTFLADDFVGSSNISLGQLRTTYRLNYHMDLVAEGRMIWQPSADYTESGILLEAGYYVTPELRLALGYVFGSADDDDFTGTRSAGGPYVGMTIKLNSLLDGFGQHRAPTAPEVIPQKKKPKKKKTNSEAKSRETEDRSRETEDRSQKQI